MKTKFFFFAFLTYFSSVFLGEASRQGEMELMLSFFHIIQGFLHSLKKAPFGIKFALFYNCGKKVQIYSPWHQFKTRPKKYYIFVMK